MLGLRHAADSAPMPVPFPNRRLERPRPSWRVCPPRQPMHVATVPVAPHAFRVDHIGARIRAMFLCPVSRRERRAAVRAGSFYSPLLPCPCPPAKSRAFPRAALVLRLLLVKLLPAPRTDRFPRSRIGRVVPPTVPSPMASMAAKQPFPRALVVRWRPVDRLPADRARAAVCGQGFRVLRRASACLAAILPCFARLVTDDGAAVPASGAPPWPRPTIPPLRRYRP